MEKIKWKSCLVELSGIPKDVMCGMPILTAIGVSELCIENHMGIIEYTEEFLRVQTKCGQIRIEGKNLMITKYSNDEIEIKGYILAITYHWKGDLRPC